jgi:hydroxyethylthiazole kinase-like uncharacterized protein yjeF
MPALTSTQAAAEAVVTAAEMRALEAAAVAAGDSEWQLMQRAGRLAADAIASFAGPASTLVAVGPGNNGGDGYVIASVLAARGWPVTVARLAEPASAAARIAAAGWTGETVALADARPAKIFVDALFGTGLSRGLDPSASGGLTRLAADAAVRIAVDLPSGVATDSGMLLSPVVTADMTITFGALKRAHVLYPAAALMGRVVVADIGIGRPGTSLFRVARPVLPALAKDTHKYRRGHVAVVAGAMPGAALLAARGAQRGGAGYVSVSGAALPPGSLVMADRAHEADCVVVGPGLGHDETARALLLRTLANSGRTVVDADAIGLLAGDLGLVAGTGRVLTPHDGEFAHAFPDLAGDRIERARAAAMRADAVIVLKGPDTVVAAPDGRTGVNTHASPRLATAGSGDVLAGMIAALVARGLDAFDAACAAVWLHGDAALRGSDGMTAEDLVELVRL